MKKFKACRKCGINFQIFSVQDLDCQECRKNANIKNSNANWAERKPRKKTKSQTNNIAYAFYKPSAGEINDRNLKY